MKLKIIGFKVGKSRPTTNRTVRDTRDQQGKGWPIDEDELRLGKLIFRIFDNSSDFISIRRVDD